MKIFVIVLVHLLTSVCYCDNVEVKLEQGVLSGKIEKTVLKGENYYAFKGIPFAEPPIGKLRFQPPVPHKGWDETYEALVDKPTCMQFNSLMRMDEPFGISGSEDCLFISVFTPDIKGSAPVVVFDYNDSFRTGFNGTQTYTPEFFVEEGVIVVTISHRLGIMGYLTTEDEVIPGNNGLRDFILGLKWVQNNIKEFGGDPERVTLMGSRGGAAIVEIMLLTEKAKGLFSAAMIHSGTVLEYSYFFENPRRKAFELGSEVNVTTEDSKELLEGLQTIDAEELYKNEVKVLKQSDETRKSNSMPFAPTIEGNIEDAVLPFLPENGKIVNDVPIIFGLTSREGLDIASHFLFMPRLLPATIEEHILQVPIRTDFIFDEKDPVYKEATQELLEFYFEDKSIHYGNILEYTVYAGDVLRNYAYHKSIKKLVAEMESPIFYYVFDFRGQLNENSEHLAKRSLIPLEHTGATVLDELCYLHLCSRIKEYYEQTKTLASDPKEVKILRQMVRMWTNFAKTRNPTPNEKDKTLKDFVWKPLDKQSDDLNYLHITTKLRMQSNPFKDRIDFWDKFLEKYSSMAIDGVVRKPETFKDEL